MGDKVFRSKNTGELHILTSKEVVKSHLIPRDLWTYEMKRVCLPFTFFYALKACPNGLFENDEI